MNRINYTLALIGLSLAINAQVSQNASLQNMDVVTPEAKSNFINNQSYLSKSTLKDYKTYYGDSLKGFDEAAAKVKILNDGFYGVEFINVMNYTKRDFIAKKYKIGLYSPNYKVPSIPVGNLPNVGGKPIGGNNQVNLAPCVNEDFELTAAGPYLGAANALAVTNWTIESSANNNQNSGCIVGSYTNPNFGFSLGSPEFSIMTTPILGVPLIGTIPHSPLGGTRIAKLNNEVAGAPLFLISRISTTFPVTNANTLFQFAYCGSWDGSGHSCCAQPFFRINLYDCNGAPLACASVTLTAPGAGCPSPVPGYTVSPGGIAWKPWSTHFIDLTPFIGQCITIRVTNGDCSGGAHYGALYFDALCGGQLVGAGIPGVGGNIAGPVSFCAGSNQAQIAAPLGYSTYLWVAPLGAPPIPAAQATLPVLTIPNPIIGSTYSVFLGAASGCQFIATNVIQTTTVQIIGLGASPTCPGGASGTATVQGNGSGTGYTYTWTNSSNSVVGTSSVATGLAPGSYTIVIAGAGAAGCGTAQGVVTVTTAPTAPISLLKPFCNGQAYLSTAGGSNYQWYAPGGVAVSPTLGGIAPSYTVTNPVNGSIWTLRYTSAQGCQDSVLYTLVASPPGNISIPYNKLICPGGTNGEAIISLVTAPGAPPGVNSFSVYNVSPTPAYNASVFPTAALQFSVGNLVAGGTYSVNVFDGSCAYSANFTVPFYTYSWALTPSLSLLCPGQQIAAGVSFPTPVTPTQYTYSWTPNNFLAGNLNTLQNTIITPTAPIGSSVATVYTVVVTPTVANCPTSKTMTVIAINPPIPTITAIPALCNNSPLYAIQVSPPGGTFVPSVPGSINPNTGVITPSLCNFGANNNGTNTVTYNLLYGGACLTTNSATFQVSQFNTAALVASVSPICVTNPAINLNNLAQIPGHTWTGVQGVVNGQFVPTNLQTGVYTAAYNTTSTPNPQACPHFTTINISVTKTITPLITQVPDFCNNELPKTMTVNPPGGNWLGTGVSAGGVITPSNYPQATNVTVGYTINIGPCVNTNTTVLNVHKFNTANLTGSVTNLCFNSNPFNLLSITQNTLGTWYGVNVNLNSFNPANLPTSVHTLTYVNSSSPNPTLCANSRTINVSVYKPDAPNITQVGPFCSKVAPVQLSVTPNIGNWTSTSFLTPAGVLIPSLCAVGANPVQYVVGNNTCNVQQTKFINIEAFVPATITKALSDQCNTSPALNLIPYTLSNLGIWSGPGISGAIFNPGTSGAGQFVLTHNTASSPSGLCPDQATIAVNVYSLSAPVFAPVKSVCNNGAPVQLQVDPLGGYFGGANNNGVDKKGLFNPGLGIVGSNVINYSITSGPCVAYAQTTVNVDKFVSADFDLYPGPYCKNHEAVNMNSFVQNPGGDWTSNTFGAIVGTMFHPGKASTGINTVTYKTQSIPNKICSDEKTIQINVLEAKALSVNQKVSGLCAPVTANMWIENTNTGKVEWNFGDGSEKQTGFETTHIFTTPGTYTLSYNYHDGLACSTQSVISPVIVVYQKPKADFHLPEQILISSPEVQLTNQSTELTDNKYRWKIDELNYLSTEVHPKVALPEKIGKYQVTLIAENKNGCKDELTKFVEVKNDFNIFIPTSFTPNYDNLNDVFKPEFTPYGLDEKNFEMEIFDRWGHSLFRTKDPRKGWDGSYKGEILKEEVYVYRIKYKDLDGNSYSKMGHVSLIK